MNIRSLKPSRVAITHALQDQEPTPQASHRRPFSSRRINSAVARSALGAYAQNQVKMISRVASASSFVKNDEGSM